MCAINGCTGSATDRVTRMNAVTAHRGPDGTRVLNIGDITLGYNRLAIIDLDERAMQPMQTSDERFTIVYNGELYNYRELKQELAPYPFKTESDTEVVLAAYATWGSASFAKLNGMFAFAVWDAQEKKLILVRDPVGIKPLYYYCKDGEFIFSSEVRGILAAGVTPTVDTTALGHYLRLMYVPGDMTMLAGVKKLLPGQTLTVARGALSFGVLPPWPVPTAPQTYAEGVVRVHDTVTAAVARQLVSDRPVGVYLSGGIDSSIVLAAASRVHPNINTYSVGFEVAATEDPYKFNADSILAKKTAAQFGATHHEHILTTSDVFALFPTMIAAMDVPIGNATTLAQRFLAEKTRDTATVVLSGEGGDELFGGYERYRLALTAASVARFVPTALTQLLPGSLKHIGLSGVDRYLQLMTTKDAELQPLLRAPLPDTRGLFALEFTGADIADELMRADERSWLVDEALLRADTMGMGASIEARVPLLDLEVRALAHTLPRTWKVDMRTTKKILKDAFRTELPTDVLLQPKRGWYSPGAKWLRRPEFVALTDDVFSDGYTAASSLFNLDAVRALLSAHRDLRGYHYTVLWAIMVFLVWAKENNVTLPAHTLR